MKYIPVIGLEIHAELLTRSKVFCTCSAEFGGEANSRCCPRCAGLPGAMPVLNRGAAELAVRAGLALGCEINSYSAFDRKNYFYPDLPKACQTTQYYHPICGPGAVWACGKKIRIHHIHIEEDAGKLIHDDFEGISLADYNRSSVGLIEIVTEPDIRSAAEAREFVEQVNQRLRYAGVCDGRMEQGSFRVDVNVSIMEEGAAEFGTRAEIKNLNSLKFIVRAIEHEIERQTRLLDGGKKVKQETRRFNENHGTTHALRTKEEAHDYRYFPDPDILPLHFSKEDIERVRSEMPEMPDARLARYTGDFGLSEEDARLILTEKELSDFFDAAAEEYPAYKAISNLLLVEVLRRLNDLSLSAAQIPFAPAEFARLVKLSDDGKITKTAAKDILRIMFETGEGPEKIAKERGFLAVVDTDRIKAEAIATISENPKAVEEYRAGSKKVFGFLMGQALGKLGKGARPDAVKNALESLLKGE